MHQSNEYGVKLDERRATFHVKIKLPFEIILISYRLYELIDQLATYFAFVFNCYCTETKLPASGTLVAKKYVYH